MKARKHTCDPNTIVILENTTVFLVHTSAISPDETFNYPTKEGALKHFKRITAKQAGRPCDMKHLVSKVFHQIFKS